MAEPLKKDEALAAAVREAFQRHMEAARQASQALKEKQAAAPSASLAPSTLPPLTSRDLRLAVPTPANDGRVAPPTAETRPAPVPVRPAVETPSLSRLVAIASPQKAAEELPPIIETAKAPVVEAVVPAAEAVPVPPVAPVEAAVAQTVIAAPSAESAPVIEPEPETKPEVMSHASAEEAAADTGLDFGEALFFEIAPDHDKSAQAEQPKMPKAASLDTPLREPSSQLGADDLEFRQPPSRERPRMSTANPTAAAPQDLDLLAPTGKPLPVEAKPVVVKEDKTTNQPAVAKSATRFGVAAPAKPAPAVAKTVGRFARRGTFKIPTALVASVSLAVVIAGVGAYAWTNPDKLQWLSALVAPPAPPASQVASTAPQTKPAEQDTKIAAPLPTTQVATVPTVPASSIASVPAPVPPAATRSVSTVAITLDEVDEAVQSARELTAIGDIDGARQALESYKTGSDPRALFALAETYDPAIVKDASKADPAQAKNFYEAAAKAGSQDNTADRIARLALAHAN